MPLRLHFSHEYFRQISPPFSFSSMMIYFFHMTFRAAHLRFEPPFFHFHSAPISSFSISHITIFSPSHVDRASFHFLSRHFFAADLMTFRDYFRRCCLMMRHLRPFDLPPARAPLAAAAARRYGAPPFSPDIHAEALRAAADTRPTSLARRRHLIIAACHAIIRAPPLARLRGCRCRRRCRRRHARPTAPL